MSGYGHCLTCGGIKPLDVGVCGRCAGDWQSPAGQQRINARRKTAGLEPLDTFHTITAPPEGAICDFCSSPDVRWTFPCRGHTAADNLDAVLQHRDGSVSVESMEVTRIADGGWAACSACHALIQRGDRVRLARRSAKRMIRDHPDIPMVLDNAIGHVRRLQDAFWANREGPPIHHDSRPREDPTR